MGMADAATALWTRYLKFDAADPRWPDRDRFVLSAGHGSMLLYALLHLTGHAGMGIEELRRFRQLTPRPPATRNSASIRRSRPPPARSARVSPTAVGMALAERMLAARFGKQPGRPPHLGDRVDGDLMEGISHEAAALAGHLQLEKLTRPVGRQQHLHRRRHRPVLLRRHAEAFRRLWLGGRSGSMATMPAAVAAALSLAMRSRKPTLIACRTIIGFSAPTKAGTAGAHGRPLGAEEARGAKRALGLEPRRLRGAGRHRASTGKWPAAAARRPAGPG